MTALVRVFEDIRLNLVLNQPTILVLFDVFKAFDSVCRGLFCLCLLMMSDVLEISYVFSTTGRGIYSKSGFVLIF
jgi:hypothetical protein